MANLDRLQGIIRQRDLTIKNLKQELAEKNAENMKLKSTVDKLRTIQPSPVKPPVVRSRAPGIAPVKPDEDVILAKVPKPYK